MKTAYVSRRINNVQALRGIAASMVVIQHFSHLESKTIPGTASFVRWFEPIGFTGVDLFFVISGFVIITSTWTTFARAGIGANFLLRRAARIFPIYWIALIPLVVLDIFAPSWVLSSQTVRPNLFASFALLPQAGLPLLTVSWSLVYEMYFYYLFTAAIRGPLQRLPYLVGGWMLFTALIAVLFHGATNPYLTTLGNTITYEFAFGVAIGWWVIHERKSRYCIAAIALGVVAILAAGLLYPGHGDMPYGQLRFLICGVPMALILYGFVGLEISKTFVIGGALVALGDASYSMYLWHVPVLAAVNHVFAHRAVLRIPAVHAAWLVACFLIVLAVSLAVYRFIELPLNRFFARVLRSKPRQAIIPQLDYPATVESR